MDWMIISMKDIREVSTLINTKQKFFDSMQDLGTINAMTGEVYACLNITSGLGKRILYSVKRFMSKPL